MLIWKKMNLGVIDFLVFGICIILFWALAFLLFDKILWRALIGFLGGGGIGSFLLIGSPNKRIYNYIFLIFSYIIEKKKLKGDNIHKLSPYKKIKDDELITKEGKSIFVYRIYGNDILYNLDSDIERKLEAFEQLFQTQNLSYQIVKQERKWDDQEQLNSLNNIKTKNQYKLKIIEDNKYILKCLNSEDDYYENYFIEFSSKNNSKLELESETITNCLTSAGLSFRKLDTINLAKYAFKKILPQEVGDDIQFKIQDNIIDLVSEWDKLLKNQKIKIKARIVKTKNGYHKIIAIDQFPLHSSLCFLENVFNSENTQVILQVRNMDSNEAIKMINSKYREMNAQINSKGNKLSDNKEQNIYLDSMEELMNNIQSSGEELKAVNLWITIFAKTISKLYKIEREIKKDIKRSRMKYDDLLMKQNDAMLSIDLSTVNPVEFKTQLEIGSQALSHSWPFTSESFNDVTGDFIGVASKGKPCFLDFSYRSSKEERHQSNSFILGTSGGGKTTFTERLVKNEWSRGTTCYLLDPENEYSVLAKNLGGICIDLSGIKNFFGKIERLNPLQVFVGTTLDTEDDDLNKTTEDWFSSHYKFLNDFFTQLLYPGKTDTVIEMAYLKRALQLVYEEKKLTNAKNLKNLNNNKWPVMSDLYKKLRFLAKKPPTEFTNKKLFQELSERIFDLTTKGTEGNLWDGHTTLDIDAETFVVFNFKNLMEDGNERIIGAQSYLTYKYILHIIFLNKEKADKEERIQNVSITIDEAHKFINPDNPSGVYFAFSMYKRIRKYHGWIRMTTQNISDFTADQKIKKETSGMINNSEFLFVFKLKPKDISDLDDLIKISGGLTNREKSFLGSNQSHKYLFFSGSYRTTIKAHYFDSELKLFGWSENDRREYEKSTR